MSRRRNLGLLALAAGLAACGRTPGSDRLPAGTPVVLISIDTLRADHLPAWGYQNVETQALDALRRDSILFKRAYSHTPLTLPSQATLRMPSLVWTPSGCAELRMVGASPPTLVERTT